MTPNYLSQHPNASANFTVLEEDRQFLFSNMDEILPEETWEEVEDEPLNPALDETLLQPTEIN